MDSAKHRCLTIDQVPFNHALYYKIYATTVPNKTPT